MTGNGPNVFLGHNWGHNDTTCDHLRRAVVQVEFRQGSVFANLLHPLGLPHDKKRNFQRKWLRQSSFLPRVAIVRDWYKPTRLLLMQLL